jgi:hypothetical protein
MRLSVATPLRQAIIPGVAVSYLLKSWRAEGAVERGSLVARHTGLRVRVARDHVVGLLDGDVSGDEHPARTVVLAACEQEAARRDLLFQEIEVGRTGLFDDLGRLQIRRLEDVDHGVDVS